VPFLYAEFAVGGHRVGLQLGGLQDHSHPLAVPFGFRLVKSVERQQG